jgi:hypothetical protein
MAKRSVPLFLEKCCVKENIEDSPFLGSIDALDEERITILNYLIEANPKKIDKYKLEIRGITQETSLRKGLLQIHESRIYVDDQSILKVHSIKPREFFDTYVMLNNVRINNVSVMLLGGEMDQPNVHQTAYYFKRTLIGRRTGGI